MLCLHFFWLIWLTPARTEKSAPGGRASRFYFLPIGEGNAAAGSRIWSPVLMALPTRAGFSGAAIDQEIGVGPRVEKPSGRVRFLERDQVGWSEHEQGETAPPGGSVTSARVPEELAWAGAERTVRAPVHGLQLGFSGSLDAGAFARIPMPGVPGSGPSWECEVLLWFDRFGHVSHAFMDATTGNPGHDRAILQAVYQWRLATGGETERARIRFIYVGGPVIPAGPAESNGL